ncbi:hypothetical protein INR49_005106 [Caranx melampygus]|nr:hypothetical protein INR49_005106 [Caranx melampygus]
MLSLSMMVGLVPIVSLFGLFYSAAVDENFPQGCTSSSSLCFYSLLLPVTIPVYVFFHLFISGDSGLRDRPSPLVLKKKDSLSLVWTARTCSRTKDKVMSGFPVLQGGSLSSLEFADLASDSDRGLRVVFPLLSELTDNRLQPEGSFFTSASFISEEQHGCRLESFLESGHEGFPSLCCEDVATQVLFLQTGSFFFFSLRVIEVKMRNRDYKILFISFCILHLSTLCEGRPMSQVINVVYLSHNPVYRKRTVSEVQLMHNVGEHKQLQERREWLQMRLQDIHTAAARGGSSSSSSSSELGRTRRKLRPEDLPDLTPEEIQHALNFLEKLLKSKHSGEFQPVEKKRRVGMKRKEMFGSLFPKIIRGDVLVESCNVRYLHNLCHAQHLRVSG